MPERPADPARTRRGARGAGALRAAAVTHAGRVRERNEDRVLADPERGILLVVDGMGGEAAGEKAAQLALDSVRRRLERPTGSPEERLREAIAVANHEILETARRTPAWTGMGCVLTAALIEDGEVTVGHVGDSRAYALRDGRLEKITHDHSPVGEREDRGEIDESEAMSHPRRNEVYRSVGVEEHAPGDPDFVEIARFPWPAGGALLLCSDGLTDLVPAAEIELVVRAHAANPRRVAETLVEAALAAGGKDNVSVIFATGPRVATPRGRANGNGSEGAAVAVAGASDARAFLARGWVRFALGAIAGAAVAFAIAKLSPPHPAEVAGPAVAPAAAARVLEVGPGTRFRTIADALGAARAGDTVRVAPGEYREQVRLGDGVCLVSAEPRAAILAPGGDGSGALVAVVAERLGSGRIEGFTIRTGGGPSLDVGIRVSDAAITVEDVAVSGARLAGVAFEGGRTAVLRGSRIHDNPGAGVVVRAGGRVRIVNNWIEGNGRGGRERAPGVEIEPGARARLTGNVIVGNGAAGVRGVPRGGAGAIEAQNLFEAAGRRNPVAVAPAPRPAR